MKVKVFDGLRHEGKLYNKNDIVEMSKGVFESLIESRFPCREAMGGVIPPKETKKKNELKDKDI